MEFVWFYGVSSTEIRSKRPKDLKCHHCGNENHINISSHSDYFYIWFIPIIPINLYSIITCVNCQYEYSFKELDEDLKLYYKAHRPKWVFPFYNFSAVYILLIVLIALWFNKKGEQNELIDRLDTVKPNYVMDYKTEEGDYSNFIIHSIEDSNFYVSFNKYVIEDPHFLGQIEGKNNFSPDTLMMTKSKLEEWINADRISAIYPMYQFRLNYLNIQFNIVNNNFPQLD